MSTRSGRMRCDSASGRSVSRRSHPPEQQVELVGVVLGEGEVGEAHGAHARLRSVGLAAGVGAEIVQRAEAHRVHVQEDLLQVRERRVQHAGRVAHGLGDASRGDVTRSVLAHERESRLDDQRLQLFLGVSAASRHRGGRGRSSRTCRPIEGGGASESVPKYGARFADLDSDIFRIFVQRFAEVRYGMSKGALLADSSIDIDVDDTVTVTGNGLVGACVAAGRRS